jgi:hypothetical protein
MTIPATREHVVYQPEYFSRLRFMARGLNELRAAVPTVAEAKSGHGKSQGGNFYPDGIYYP